MRQHQHTLDMTSQRVHVHTTVYECHRSRVKQVEVEAGNPHLFFSVGEDGFVRQYDVRMRYGEVAHAYTCHAYIHHAYTCNGYPHHAHHIMRHTPHTHPPSHSTHDQNHFTSHNTLLAMHSTRQMLEAKSLALNKVWYVCVVCCVLCISLLFVM